VTTELRDDGKCFACGPDNPDGLQLRFVRDGEAGARTDVTIPPRLQGYRDVAHGGIVMMLLDEAMAHACRFAGEKAMTAALDARFRRPVPLGTPVIVRGRVRERRKNVLYVEASVECDGVELATGEGKFISVGPLEERYR
jgi:uncharacterized protein (TIGR00369 family)